MGTKNQQSSDVDYKIRTRRSRTGTRSSSNNNDIAVTKSLSPETASAASALSENLIFSKTTWMYLRRKSFFFSLPLRTQLILLKRLQNESVDPPEVVKELANEVGVPLLNLVGWFSYTRAKLRSAVTFVKTEEILNEEYDASPDLSEDRALILGHITNLSANDVRVWFEQKKNNGIIQPEPATPPKNAPPGSNVPAFARRFLAEQYKTLMEYFKQQNTLPDSEVDELATKTGLNPAQVFLWFKIMQKKIRTTTMGKILENLSKNLQPHQIIELEREYRNSICITPSEAVILANKLKVSQEMVFLWFKRRRVYELFKVHGDDREIKEKNRCINNILETVDLGVMSDAFSCKEQYLAGPVAANSLSSSMSTNLVPPLSSPNLLPPSNTTDPTLSSSSTDPVPPSFLIDTLPPSSSTEATSPSFPADPIPPSYLTDPLLSSLPTTTGTLSFSTDPMPPLSATDPLPPSAPTNFELYKEEVNVPQNPKKDNLNKSSASDSGENSDSKRKYFTDAQSAILSELFLKQDTIDRDEAEKIAVKLGAPDEVKRVMKWFENKRYRKRRSGKLLVSHEQPPEPKTLRTRSRSSEIIVEQSQPSSSVENVLFEEFKKSSSLTRERHEMLQKRLNLSAKRITAFFTQLTSRLASKTSHELAKQLSSYTNAYLIKLIAEYRKNRFMSVVKRQMLAKQLGTSRSVINDWFCNARLYEISTGNKFTLEIARYERKKATTTSESSGPRDARKNAKKNGTYKKSNSHVKRSSVVPLSKSKEKCLRNECAKNPHLTEEQMKALASRFHLSRHVILNWIQDNMPSVMLLGDKDKECDEEHETSKMIGRVKTPLQLNLLFNAFKLTSYPSSSTIDDLAAQSNLQTEKVKQWFMQMREKLVAMPGEILLDSYRNRNLNEEQVRLLESKFQMHPYEEPKTKDILAEQLGVSKRFVQNWFKNRRYYELILSYDAHDSGKAPSPVKRFIPNESALHKTADMNENVVAKIESDESFNLSPSQCLSKSSGVPQATVMCTEDVKDDSSFTSNATVETIPEKSRFIVPLNADFQFKEYHVNDVFWYACEKPNIYVKCDFNREILEKLENAFIVAPRPDIHRISRLSNDLKVSQQSVYWWFVAKRFQSRSQVSQNSIDIDLPPVLEREDLPSTSTQVSPTEENDITSQPNSCTAIAVADSKKKKFAFTTLQRRILLQEYKRSPFVSASKARMLANDLNLSVKRVEWWFENRRSLQLKTQSEPKQEEKIKKDEEPDQPLTKWQIFVLDREYVKNSKLTKQRVEFLVKKLRSSRRPIMRWFKNRKNQRENI